MYGIEMEGRSKSNMHRKCANQDKTEDLVKDEIV